jgi:hypothetical protein
MSNDKVKLYKNKERGQETHTPYVPQYQVLGVEPGQYKSAVVPLETPVAQTSTENPRAKRAPLRQPYSGVVDSPVGVGKGPIPNVGNNVEHTWSSVDGEIVDDLSGESMDPDQPMIDNNQYVTDRSLGLGTSQANLNLSLPKEYVSAMTTGIHGGGKLPTLADIVNGQPPTTIAYQGQYRSAEVLPVLDEVRNPPPKQFVDPTPSTEEDLFPIVRDLEEGAYLLIVNGVPLCSGPKEEIEEQAKALVFGEHEMCDGNPVPDDDIIIIKRVPIKIGLFLE